MTTEETKDGFQFYLRFAKPLVLHLPSPKDRVLAAAWIQKLKDHAFGTEKARTDHLKLLLFVLQKGKLFGPFVNNPAQHDALQEFPVAIKLRDIAKSWVESEDALKRARLMEGLGAGDHPPLTTECSADLLEYVAAQDIPNFGVHAYYAISNEPINTWENLEKGIFPKGALSAVRKVESADVSAAASARRSRSRSRSKSRSRTADDLNVSGRERGSIAQVSFRSDVGERSFPGQSEGKPPSPLGSPPPPERTTPTWGSNLISVGDPPSPEGMAFAPPKESVSAADKETPKSVSLKDRSAFGLPYKTPPLDTTPPIPSARRRLDFSDLDATPITTKPLPCIPEKLSFPSPSPKTSTPVFGLYPPVIPGADISDLYMEEPPSFLADDDMMTTPPRPTRRVFEEAPSLPYQTPPWDMSAASVPYQTPPITTKQLPCIPEKLSFPSPSPKTSTPVFGLYPPVIPGADISDLYMEEPPSFLADDDIMVTPPRPTRRVFEEAPSLPYQTPPWDMSAASVPYQTPPWDMSAASVPYQTPPWDMSAASVPYQTPPWDMSAASVPYRTPPWDMSAASIPYKTPPRDISAPSVPPRMPPCDMSPPISAYQKLQEFVPSPLLPNADASLLFEEETPSFFDDEEMLVTPPRPGHAYFEDAPSLPYQTPPWDMSAASLPYRTPEWDRSAPSLPYRTPPFDYSAPSVPYKTPEWDMSAPSVPYRTPDWDLSAPSLPYKTPPYDPHVMARSQYASLFDGPIATSSPKRAPKPSKTSKIPRTAQTPVRHLPEEEIDDFSIMERIFAAEDVTEGSTEDFSAIEKWAEGPSETPPAAFPRKKRTPPREVQEVLTQGISVTPEAQDIVTDAIREMSTVGEEAADLEQLYEEEYSAFPHRHRGMRTPPVFSKSSRIREAGRHIRYKEEEFEVAEPIDWRPAADVVTSADQPRSPRVDLRQKMEKRPFKEVFPGVKMPMDFVPFDEDDELDLIDDEILVQSPKKKDLQNRLHEVMDEIDRLGEEVPAFGGVGLTTPKRAPSPVRPDRYDDLLFTEMPPDLLAMSPEDYLSPMSKAAAQWEALHEPSPPPPRKRTPSPPRIETPEFLRERRISPLPDIESEPEEEPEPTTPKRKRKGKKKKGETSFVGVETEGGVINEQVEELYKSLVVEEEEIPQLTPPPISPLPPYSPGTPFEKVQLPPIPPKYTEQIFYTPPRKRITREEFPEALEFEEEPDLEDPWLSSPPTPPSPFEYESPQLSPLAESPPLKQLLEAHEFTEDFFDPDRPHIHKSVTIGGGTRVPLRRRSRPPVLSPITDEHLEGLFPSPPPGDAFERALERARQFAPPTPPTPAPPPKEPEVCKKGPKGAKGVKGKGRRARPSTSKTKLKPATVSPSKEKTPPPPTTPGRPDMIRTPYRPLTRNEQYFAESFSDPKHQELVARVTKLIADVGSPLIKSPPPEQDEFGDIEGIEDFDTSMPEFGFPPDEELPDYSPQPPRSPEMPIPQFDFAPEFFTPPKPYKLPIVPLSPSEYPSPPPLPQFAPFPYFQSGFSQSPMSGIFDTTPPLEMDSPPPATPESPDIDPVIFSAEVLGAISPIYYDAMKVRQGDGKFMIVRRHSRGPGVRKIFEAPETEEFEEHMPFLERVSSAEPSKRRTVRAGTKKIGRRSIAPGLPTVAEYIDYPDSPITTRSPASPPRVLSPRRPRPVVEESERLIDLPCDTCSPQQPRPSRIKRRARGRKIDFDAPAPSPQSPKSIGRQITEEEEEPIGPPPEDLFGERHPVRYEMRQESIIDYPIPDLPSPTVRPKFKLDWYETPPHLKMPEPPKKEFEFKLLPQLRNVLDYESPIDLPPSPEPLPEEFEEFDDFPMATAMPGFPPTPSPPPISPFKLPPSPEKRFARQITPEPIRQRKGRPARVPTPPRKIKTPNAALLAAHRQFQSLLRDTPPQASPVSGPSSSVVTTSETIISPKERRTTTKTTKKTTPSPGTPPMFIIPPSYVDPFLEPQQIDLFQEEMPEMMELSREETMRRGARAAPRRSIRRPVQLYGYGEREPLKLERKQRPPCLGALSEVADEPADDYQYWPGPHIPQVSKPTPMYSGGRFGPRVYRNVPPVSGKGVVSDKWQDAARAVMPQKPKPAVPPASISPQQIRRGRRERIPRSTMTARKKLVFEDSPKTYEEHLERLVADIPVPEHITPPQLPPAAYIEFEPPEWSPVPLRALIPPGAKGFDLEESIDFSEFDSPKPSPGLPPADLDWSLGGESPPLDILSPEHSPVFDFSPPPGMAELDELVTPPCSPVRPESSPEELRRRIQEHEYTIHQGDTRKEHLSKYVHVKGRPYKVRKSQRPPLISLHEQEEPIESPRIRTPPHVPEGTLLDITPPVRDPMQNILDLAARQYAMLFESPEEEAADIDTSGVEEPIIDEPVPLGVRRKLPLPVQEQFYFEPMEQIKPVEIPPYYLPPPLSSPERFMAMAPTQTDYMLDYMDSPPLLSTPPRDIFDIIGEGGKGIEDDEDEDIEALLAGSPVRRTPPGSTTIAFDKLVEPELLDKVTRFTDNNSTLPNTNTEKEAPQTLNCRELTQNNDTFLHIHSKYQYNDLAYCIQKGLDYFPIKEGDTKFINTIPSNLDVEDTAISVFDITKTSSTNLLKMEKLKVHIQAMNFKNLISLQHHSYFSEYTIAFYYFLGAVNSDEERTLPTNTPGGAISPHPQRTSTPISFHSRQQPFQRLASPIPFTHGNIANSVIQTVYKSPEMGSSASNCSTISSITCNSESSRGCVNYQDQSIRNNNMVRLRAAPGLPLTLPKTPPPPFQRLSPSIPVPNNPPNQFHRTLCRPPAPYGDRESICNTLPQNSLDISRDATNVEMGRESPPISFRPRQPIRQAGSTYATLPITSLHISGDIADETVSPRFFRQQRPSSPHPIVPPFNRGSAYNALPRTSTPISKNTTNDISVNPVNNLVVGHPDLSHACDCVKQYFNKHLNRTAPSPTCRQPVQPVNVSGSLQLRYPNIMIGDIQNQADGRHPQFRDLPSSTPRSGRVRLDAPDHSGIINDFQNLARHRTSTPKRPIVDAHPGHNTNRFRTLPRRSPPHILMDTTTDFHTLPQEENTYAFETLPRSSPPHILVNTTTDFDTLPHKDNTSEIEVEKDTVDGSDRLPDQSRIEGNNIEDDSRDVDDTVESNAKQFTFHRSSIPIAKRHKDRSRCSPNRKFCEGKTSVDERLDSIICSPERASNTNIEPLPVNRRLFTTLESAPSTFSPNHSKGHSVDRKGTNVSFDNEIVKDISHHLETLPNNKNLGKDFNKTKSLDNTGSPLPAHLIISSYAPLYVTSVPTSSFNPNFVKFTPAETDILKQDKAITNNDKLMKDCSCTTELKKEDQYTDVEGIDDTKYSTAAVTEMLPETLPTKALEGDTIRMSSTPLSSLKSSESKKSSVVAEAPLLVEAKGSEIPNKTSIPRTTSVTVRSLPSLKKSQVSSEGRRFSQHSQDPQMSYISPLTQTIATGMPFPTSSKSLQPSNLSVPQQPTSISAKSSEIRNYGLSPEFAKSSSVKTTQTSPSPKTSQKSNKEEPEAILKDSKTSRRSNKRNPSNTETLKQTDTPPKLRCCAKRSRSSSKKLEPIEPQKSEISNPEKKVSIPETYSQVCPETCVVSKIESLKSEVSKKDSLKSNESNRKSVKSPSSVHSTTNRMCQSACSRIRNELSNQSHRTKFSKDILEYQSDEDFVRNICLDVDEDDSYEGGSPPCERRPCGSPVSPDFMSRVKEHQFTEGFLDPKRPMARKSVRSRENVVRLRRRAPSPPLERVHEVPEVPVVSPDARGLRPTLYQTAEPPSAERHYRPPYFPDTPRPIKPRTPIPLPPSSPVRPVDRTLPKRRLVFDDEPTPSPPRKSPEKVTTTETVAYKDPKTGAPVTETTVRETVYTSPRGAAARTPERRMTPKRKSPSAPCSPRIMSPKEYEICDAFAGRTSPDILDTSDIQMEEDAGMEPFSWLDH